jgi:hypothetical protein
MVNYQSTTPRRRPSASKGILVGTNLWTLSLQAVPDYFHTELLAYQASLFLAVMQTQALDHTANAYLAVSLSPSSPYIQNPSALSSAHPLITHVGQVGEMKDVQLLSIPRQEWDRAQHDILGSLNTHEGITWVDVQIVKQRAKKGADEL